MHDQSYKTAGELAGHCQKALAALVKRGSAGASDLIFETPEILHALRDLGLSEGDVSLEARVAAAIETAIGELPPDDKEAAQIMLGFKPSARGLRLGERREEAAEVLGVTAGTFRNRQEGRLLEDLAKRLAAVLLSPSRLSTPSVAGATGLFPRQVLLIHREDSFGVGEVSKLVESMGLEPIRWQEALDRVGFSSPSVLDRFKSCVDIAQAVLVVLEGGGGLSTSSLAFEAGVALGVVPSRTIVVQLGDEDLVQDLAGVNVLRLRNTTESAMALRSALQAAGCVVNDGPLPASSQKGEGTSAGWFRWTPDHAASFAYEDIAAAVRDFEPLDFEAGHAASAWLKEQSLEEYPDVVTWLRIGNARLEGFVALQAGSLGLSGSSSRRRQLTGNVDEPMGVMYIKWMARHREAVGGGRELIAHAAAISVKAGREFGIRAIVIEPYDEVEAKLLTTKHSFLSAGKDDETKLWLPIHDPGIWAGPDPPGF